MNPDPNRPAWDDLVRRARADAPPGVDISALLRAVRQHPAPAGPDWLAAFAELFGSRRRLPALVAATAGLGLITAWQAAELWRALPWALVLASGPGGAP